MYYYYSCSLIVTILPNYPSQLEQNQFFKILKFKNIKIQKFKNSKIKKKLKKNLKKFKKKFKKN